MSPRQRRAAGERLTDAFFRSLMQVRLNCIVKDTEPRSPEGFAAAPIHRPCPPPAACGRSAWPAEVAAPRVAEARAKRGKTPVGGERQTERGARPSGRSRGPSNRSPPSGSALRAAVRTDQSSARRRQREDATRRDGVGAGGFATFACSRSANAAGALASSWGNGRTARNAGQRRRRSRWLRSRCPGSRA